MHRIPFFCYRLSDSNDSTEKSLSSEASSHSPTQNVPHFVKPKVSQEQTTGLVPEIHTPNLFIFQTSIFIFSYVGVTNNAGSGLDERVYLLLIPVLNYVIKPYAMKAYGVADV
jgi:hypothetical protein